MDNTHQTDIVQIETAEDLPPGWLDNLAFTTAVPTPTKEMECRNDQEL